MDFEWTADQLRLRRGAEEFASTRLDGVIERDRDGSFSRELWQACADFGLQGLLVPEAWSGAGQDLLSAVAVLEGIGYGARDNGLVFSVAAHAASCEAHLCAFGSAAQQREWLPRLVNGSVIGATAITEPDSGSNALGLATTAMPHGDEWVLNGSKTFVTNAPVADLFVVYARTGAGFAGITCFLLPRNAEGLTVGPGIEKMGLRTSPMSQVYMNACRVPASAVVGGVGSGAMIFSQSMEVERLLVMAPAIGVMERILERSTDHARQRTVGSSPIGKHQAIAHRIADMELQLEAARLPFVPCRVAADAPRHRDSRIGTRQARRERSLRRHVPQRPADLRGLRLHGRVPRSSGNCGMPSLPRSTWGRPRSSAT